MINIDEVISTPSLERDVGIQKEERGFGLYEMQGLRPTQEDAAMARWYSAHVFAALSAQEIGRRLWTTYKLLNQHCCRPNFAGSTASTTVYNGQDELITATLGDAVAFAVVYLPNGQVHAVTRLNKVIHHPDDDKERFAKAGGVIVAGRAQGLNGSLALSRALGDYEYSKLGVCDDAHIDITNIHDLASEAIGKIQIITTCDGFTDPASKQTKAGHEQWLLQCLQAMQNPGNLPEVKLANLLALNAFNANSQDNISVLVQTVLKDQAFLIGVYDGHGGTQTSSYVAGHIGMVFEQQCALSPQEYAKQRLSADRYFEIYYRDNKDESFYQHMSAEKEEHTTELPKSGGIGERLKRLFHKKMN